MREREREGEKKRWKRDRLRWTEGDGGRPRETQRKTKMKRVKEDKEKGISHAGYENDDFISNSIMFLFFTFVPIFILTTAHSSV